MPTETIQISDAMTIPLVTPAMIDVGGISGEFSEVKITQLQINENGGYIGIIPGNAALLSNMGQNFNFNDFNPITVAAIRNAVKLIGEEWAAKVA